MVRMGQHFIETVPRRGYRFMGEVKTLVEPEAEEWILASRTRTRIVHEEKRPAMDGSFKPYRRRRSRPGPLRLSQRAPKRFLAARSSWFRSSGSACWLVDST